MKKIIITLSLMFFISMASMAQASPSYKATLKKLMEVSGSINTYKSVVDQMITMFKTQKQEIPAEFWDEMTTEMNKFVVDDIVNLSLPAYYNNLTEADLKGIIAFYESPTGKKFAEKTPMITKESMAAGQEWGKKLGESIVEKMKAKGFL